MFPTGSLYRLDVFKPISTIDVITNAQSGEIVGFKEVQSAGQDADARPERSTAMTREPGSLEDFHRYAHTRGKWAVGWGLNTCS